ncbi:MAG: hypothetical protein LBG72_08780 [Spirochaetaceae bacterium]|nr:hypothetical protein [Spirochaetaceae bacterium]
MTGSNPPRTADLRQQPSERTHTLSPNVHSPRAAHSCNMAIIPATHYSLPTTHYSLSTVHCILHPCVLNMIF